MASGRESGASRRRASAASTARPAASGLKASASSRKTNPDIGAGPACRTPAATSAKITPTCATAAATSVAPWYACAARAERARRATRTARSAVPPGRDAEPDGEGDRRADHEGDRHENARRQQQRSGQMCERGPPGAVIDQLDRQGKTGEQHARPGDGVGPREYSRDRAETSGEEQVRVRRAVTVRCEPPVETSRPERADDPHDRRAERRLVRHEHVVRGEVDRDEQRPDHEERPPRLLDARDTVAQEAGGQEPERPDDHERETYGVRDLLARDVHE